MALTLKTSGIATNLVMCVAVDDDNTTIKEFVSTDVNTNKVVDANVTVGTSTWKGTTRPYFQTLANGSFNVYGITFPSGHRPTTSDTDTDGLAFFTAFAGSGTPSGVAFDIKGSIAQGQTSGKLSCYGGGSFHGGGTTTIPSDLTTKFSVGMNQQFSSGAAFYYGLESGSLAADGTTTASAGFGSASDTFTDIGGLNGSGNWPGKRHICCLFNRQLTLSEMQSLHTDWRGTLFDASAPANPPPTFSGTIANISTVVSVAMTSVDVHADFSDTDTLTYSAIGSWPTGVTVNSSTGVISGTPTVQGTYASLQVRATDTASQTVNSNAFTITVTAPGATITTEALKNNTGQLFVNETGATAYIYNSTTGALVVKLSNQTTNSSGVMTLTDSTLVASTAYRVVVVLGSGAIGLSSYTAA